MNLTEQIIGNFPKTIDKSKPVFSKLIANDDKDGVLQAQIEYLLAYMKEWVSTPDVYEQHGDMLDKTISFFSYLTQFVDETETSLKNRFRAIFVRNHDTKWGTPFDVKNVFRQYFPNAMIYLVENTNKIDSTEPGLANILQDGDISTDTPTEWNLENCAATSDARFSKGFGIEFNQSGGSLSQTVRIATTREVEEPEPHSVKIPYYLHFFLKGKINVQVQDSSNRYWDYDNKVWKATEVNNSFETADWDNCSLFFILDDTNEFEDVTITFNYADGLAYADYFRLFAKQAYSSFTVIAHFEGYSASGVFGLAAGDDDPNIETESATPPQPRYGNYGYFDRSFLSGVPTGYAQDIYEDLLDYLRSQGVRAFLNIVIRDYVEEEAM